MKRSKDLKLKELVGKNAMKAYDNYVNLKELADLSFFADTQEDLAGYSNYNLKDYCYPIGLVFKEN